MIMYRKDLLDADGITLKDKPTWEKVEEAAASMTDKDAGQYGICLRGKPGWGDNMAFLPAMANSYGAQLFNMDWHLRLTARSGARPSPTT